MIPWQKHDPENPPKTNQVCIVLDEYRMSWIASYQSFGWIHDFNGKLIERPITHWAPINLPGEETQ